MTPLQIMPSDPDLVIRLEVDHVSEPSFEGSASSVFYAKDLPWNLFVKSEESGGANYVDAGLVCSLESEGLGWSYDALAEFHLINTNTCHANKVRQGFVKDDSFTIEGRLYVKKTVGVCKLNLIDFTTPIDGYNKDVLIVEGEKLHVSKEFLAVNSPVFATMFFGDFAEKNKEEIELHDVRYWKFVDLLNVIYPTSIEISAPTLSHILVLADRFQIQGVLKRAESYLIRSTQFETIAKLKFADDYRLNRLLCHTLASCKSVSTLKALKPTPEYEEFSDKTKAAICDRMMDL